MSDAKKKLRAAARALHKAACVKRSEAASFIRSAELFDGAAIECEGFEDAPDAEAEIGLRRAMDACPEAFHDATPKDAAS